MPLTRLRSLPLRSRGVSHAKNIGIHKLRYWGFRIFPALARSCYYTKYKLLLVFCFSFSEYSELHRWMIYSIVVRWKFCILPESQTFREFLGDQNYRLVGCIRCKRCISGHFLSATLDHVMPSRSAKHLAVGLTNFGELSSLISWDISTFSSLNLSIIAPKNVTPPSPPLQPEIPNWTTHRLLPFCWHISSVTPTLWPALSNHWHECYFGLQQILSICIMWRDGVVNVYPNSPC